MDGSYDGLKYLSENLLSEGTTSYLATTMTQSTDKIDTALINIAKYEVEQDVHNAAEIVGIHLEGPFISENKVGAQHPQYVVRPFIDKIKHFQETANGLIKIMTFAPEVEGAKEALETYKDDIIFQLVIQWQHTKKQLKLSSEELNMSRIYIMQRRHSNIENQVFWSSMVE